MLMEAGWDMKSISERLGHESIVTTMNTYAHISHNIAKQSIDSFDEYMERQKLKYYFVDNLWAIKIVFVDRNKIKRWSP